MGHWMLLLTRIRHGMESIMDEERVNWWQGLIEDIKPYRENPPVIVTDPLDFDKERLSQLDGLSWLNWVNIHLLAPLSSDVGDQHKQMTEFMGVLRKTAQVMRHEDYPHLLPEGYNERLVAYDTETYGLDTRMRYDYQGRLQTRVPLVGVSIAVDGENGWYLPVRHSGEDGVENWHVEVIIQMLDQLNQEFATIAHNAKYDREVLALNGVTGLRPWPYFFDTQVMDFLRDVNSHSHGLKPLSEGLLGRKMIEIHELFLGVGEAVKAKKGRKPNIFFEALPASTAYVYAGSDAINTFALFDYYRENPGRFPWFADQVKPMEIDHRCIDMVRNMSRCGMPVKFTYFYYAALDTVQRISQVREAVFKEVGFEFNIASPKELVRVLFEVLKLEPYPGMKKGKSGAYSTEEKALDTLQTHYPDLRALNLIILYRKMISNTSKIFLPTLANSFVDATMPWTKVLLDFNLTNVPTGRLSSSSGDGKERVSQKFNKTNMSAYYDRGDWKAAFNSQGIPSHYFSGVKAKKLTKIPAGAGIKELYPASVRRETLVGGEFLKNGLVGL